MITNFCEQLWIDFDLEIAVFLENLVSWLRFNASKDKPEQRNFHEGRYWSYDSYSELAKRFPGWSDQTIRRIIRRAKDAGLILIGNFNKKKYDNTNWYSLSNKAVAYFPQLHKQFSYTPDQSGNPGSDLNTPVEIDIPPVEIDRPIPEQHNSLRSNINITTSEFSNSHSNGNNDDKSDYSGNCDEVGLGVSEAVENTDYSLKSDYHKNQSQKEALLSKHEQVLGKSDHSRLNGTKSNKSQKGRAIDLMWEMIAVYRETFPDNPQPHSRVIATNLQKTLQTLIKRWHELDPNGKPFEIESFKRYMGALRTLAPKFSLREYETQHGNKKKNNMETFCRWNTVVKFLENQYS